MAAWPPKRARKGQSTPLQTPAAQRSGAALIQVRPFGSAAAIAGVLSRIMRDTDLPTDEALGVDSGSLGGDSELAADVGVSLVSVVGGERLPDLSRSPSALLLAAEVDHWPEQ